MVSFPECESDGWEGSYWKYVISLPIFIILQVLLLLNSCLYCKKLRKIPKRISISLYLTQILGLSWFLTDFMKHVVFAHSKSAIHNPIYCVLTAFGDKCFPILFTAASVSQILFRLHITFKNSAHSISSINNILLFSFFVVPFGVFVILFLIFMDGPCVQVWSPSDNPGINDLICSAGWYTHIVSRISTYLAFGLVLIANIFFGLLFSFKLNKLIKSIDETSDNKRPKSPMRKATDPSIGLRKIMTKNTILTVSIAVVKLVSYTIFFTSGTYSDIAVYLDINLNTLFLSLMFKFNDKWFYKYICKICNDCLINRSKIDIELVNYMSNPSMYSSRSRSNTQNDGHKLDVITPDVTTPEESQNHETSIKYAYSNNKREDSKHEEASKQEDIDSVP